VVLLPLFPLVALAIKLDSRGPVIFSQVRAGLGGRPFRILKLRTMRADAEEQLSNLVALDELEDPMFKLRRDPRVTRVGRVLRRLSIDELPQLVNVLRGDMSIVGPRPERPEFVSKFERTVYRYADRHRVKSGITGWAQVHGLRGKTSIEDRAEWDNWYVENASLWLDLKILAMTAVAVIAAFREVE
jgi:lipopolysaccharide/colanic/teichoic acid biosynthesis glycosyltransferase